MKALLVSTDQSVHVYTFLMNILEDRSVVLQNLFFFPIAQTDRQVSVQVDPHYQTNLESALILKSQITTKRVD